MAMPWPGNSDRVFSEAGCERAVAVLDWIKGCPSDYLLADAFKKSADMIVSQIEAGQIREHPDAYFFPVTYLYRHAVELEIKQLVRHGIRLGILRESCKLRKLLNKHELDPLWKEVERVLLHVWPDGNIDDIQNVRRMIQEFHNIDPTGQNLRYFRTRSGDSTTDGLPRTVDLVNLKNTCEGLFNFFDGCDAGLSEAEQGP